MLLTDIKEHIGYIILNRTEKKNALNFEFISLIKKVLADFRVNPLVKVVILKSNSDVFCAGADLEYLISLQNNTFEDNLKDTSHIKELFEAIYTFPKIIIAQVEGHAIAGGCGIANATDFCFATPDAKFGYSEVKIGFIPAIVSVYLVKKIGEAKSRDLLLTGKLVSGLSAVHYGIVNEIVDKDKIEETVFQFAKKLSETTSPNSIKFTKELLIQIQDKSFDEAMRIATEFNAKMRETDDFKKGIMSFIHKEKISW